MDTTLTQRRRRWTPKTPPWQEERRVVACGWCKGFVHAEWRSGMSRYVHDEQPTTEHEVLPYQVGR
jgi:hypothetical protein